MKRHNSIVILSREHHFGLLFCWKIRQGVSKQVAAERIQPYVEYFWASHLRKHFEEEETLLFTLFQGSLVEQAISEHLHIKQLIESIICAKPTYPEQLIVLADTLDNHIRFEERTLFPYMEREIPANKLMALGNQLQQLHQNPDKDDYSDEFWAKNLE